MRFRSLLLAALLVGGFIYVTSHSDSPLRRILPGGSTPFWSEPVVAHSAGLGSDEQNNIDVYKTSQESVVYVTSTVYQTSFFFEQVPVKELGSGFIINADGQILTNNHVVSGSSQVEVTLRDQSRYKAQILVKDRVNDLALIKIEPKKKLPHLNLGDSDRLQVGQKVLAIGNPFGLAGTLTVGVISALGRPIQGENNQDLEGMIQTDAAINSGNSGGPLLDSQGSVIGINTAIYGPNGGNVGIGFAMPINRAKAMLEDFRSGKELAPARLGVSSLLVSGDLARALKLPESGGLLINRVERGSAADGAGLKGADSRVIVGNYQIPVGGDLITAIDGKPVEMEDAVIRALSRKHAGEVMTLTIYRGGRTMDVKVTLGKDAGGEVLAIPNDAMRTVSPESAPLVEGSLSATGSRRALAGFFVSGVLLSFLGAILPSWKQHLSSDYTIVGLYFVGLIVGLLASVTVAPRLLESKGLGWTLAFACAIAGTGFLYLAFVSPPVSLWVARGGASGDRILSRYFAYRGFPCRLADVPSRPRRDGKPGRSAFRTGMPDGGFADLGRVLCLYGTGSASLDCGHSRGFRMDLCEDSIPSAAGAASASGAGYFPGDSESRRGIVGFAVVLSIGK